MNMPDVPWVWVLVTMLLTWFIAPKLNGALMKKG